MVGVARTARPSPLPMTGMMMSMRTLVEKSPDADMLRETIGFLDRPIEGD
jgi:hypothetical protein